MTTGKDVRFRPPRLTMDEYVAFLESAPIRADARCAAMQKRMEERIECRFSFPDAARAATRNPEGAPQK